jgi:hypothetical protein
MVLYTLYCLSVVDVFAGCCVRRGLCSEWQALCVWWGRQDSHHLDQQGKIIMAEKMQCTLLLTAPAVWLWKQVM